VAPRQVVNDSLHCYFSGEQNMKRENQLSLSTICHLGGLPQAGLGMRRRRTAGRCGSKSLFILAMSLALVAGLVSSVYGGAAGQRTEFCSTDVPKEIPDRATATSELDIDEAGPILDLDVKVTITHPWDSNMDVFLIAPDGTRVELFTDVGGMSDNFIDTVLDDDASQSITEGSAPFTGSFRPEGSLADLAGMDIGGTWKLEVSDDWEDYVGTLESWCLIATLEFAEPLPAPVIRTEAKGSGGMHDTVLWNDVGETTGFSAPGMPMTIRDNRQETSEMDVRGIGVIEDLNVQLNISHRNASDMDVFLIAPDGTRIELFTDVGGSDDDFRDTILDDEASASIKNGSAPFSGSYRPEGKLANLRGKDIHGVWTLEVTDDSAPTSGTLNSWKLIADLADIYYCAECATDRNFNDVVDESGWITETSHRFTGLNADREYFYRVKARPMSAWLQTSRADFDTDMLTNVDTTADGDVVLRGGGAGQELYVVDNPGFEDNGGWLIGFNNQYILVGGCNSVLWVSEGNWAGCVLFGEDYFYFTNDSAYFRQQVDWTGISAFKFDYCSMFGGNLRASVLIGNTVVWTKSLSDATTEPHFDETIDVSALSGYRELKLLVEVETLGSFTAGVFWDNLRTYGPGGEPTGNIISTPVSINADDIWDVLVLDGTTPPGTKLTVDILPASGTNPIGSWKQMPSSNDVPSVIDINSLNTKTIRLRANLETSNTANTPMLHSWVLTSAAAGRESDWSNVKSSRP